MTTETQPEIPAEVAEHVADDAKPLNEFKTLIARVLDAPELTPALVEPLLRIAARKVTQAQECRERAKAFADAQRVKAESCVGLATYIMDAMGQERLAAYVKANATQGRKTLIGDGFTAKVRTTAATFAVLHETQAIDAAIDMGAMALVKVPHKSLNKAEAIKWCKEHGTPLPGMVRIDETEGVSLS